MAPRTIQPIKHVENIQKMGVLQDKDFSVTQTKKGAEESDLAGSAKTPTEVETPEPEATEPEATEPDKPAKKAASRSRKQPATKD